MLGRYKTRILRLTESLRKLESNPDDLDALVALQGEIVRLIIKAEANITRVRGEMRQATTELKGGRLPREETATLRQLIQGCKMRVVDYQRLKFIWKCFGDGIAFIYLDKFALKHMYYDTANYVPKQGAGALFGKAGLKLERAIVRALRSRGIPAMLCDITNTLRHGDICVLVGPDPMPIEVKSSRHSNDRVDRQVERIKALTSFLENDEARDFRGIPHISRVEFSEPEVTHLDALTRCIADSEGNPIGIVSPEAGLNYLCIRESGGLDQLPTGTINRDIMMCLVNEAKTDQSWPPYYPLTLSIRNPHHLYAFMRGEISLAVIVDVSELRRQFLSRGLEIVLRCDGDWAVWMRRSGEEGVSAVSRQVLGRLFHEFQSLSWFVAVNSDYARHIEKRLAEQAELAGSGRGQPTSGWIAEIPKELQHLLGEEHATPEATPAGSMRPEKRK